jgi:hypothetical protein
MHAHALRGQSSLPRASVADPYSLPNFTNDQMVVPKTTLKVTTPIHHQVTSQP